MDNQTKSFAQAVIAKLEAIRTLIHDAVMLPRQDQVTADAHEHQTDASQQQSVTRAKHPPIQVAPPITGSDTANQKNNKCLQWSTKWNPVFQVGGVIVLIIYASITAFQWSAMLEANRLSRQAFEVSNRAYVYISAIEMYSQDPTSNSVKVTIGNSGHVPSVGFAIEAKGVMGMPEALPGPGRPLHFSWGGEETIIPPSTNNYSVVRKIPPFIKSDLDVLESGHSIAMLNGHVYYGNGFGRIEETPFCFLYYSHPRVGWTPCPLSSNDDFAKETTGGNQASGMIELYKKQPKKK